MQVEISEVRLNSVNEQAHFFKLLSVQFSWHFSLVLMQETQVWASIHEYCDENRTFWHFFL